TGGGNGNHLVYLAGLADHKIDDACLVDHLVDLVERKAAAIEAAQAAETPAPDDGPAGNRRAVAS
ncbi:MAG: hypothetical protein K8F57_06570, partial [Alphaproteobacteria bacterium]|nr:hypothetical protein [Alphaproteobacteria bacterium]